RTTALRSRSHGTRTGPAGGSRAPRGHPDGHHAARRRGRAVAGTPCRGRDPARPRPAAGPARPRPGHLLHPLPRHGTPARAAHARTMPSPLLARLLGQAEREAASTRPLTEGERYVLHLYRASLISGLPLGTPSDEVVRLSRCLRDGATFYLVPGEAWSDAVNA